MLLHSEGLLPNLRVEHLGNGCRKARKTSRYKMEFDVVIFGQLGFGWGRLLVFWWWETSCAMLVILFPMLCIEVPHKVLSFSFT